MLNFSVQRNYYMQNARGRHFTEEDLLQIIHRRTPKLLVVVINFDSTFKFMISTSLGLYIRRRWITITKIGELLILRDQKVQPSKKMVQDKNSDSMDIIYNQGQTLWYPAGIP